MSDTTIPIDHSSDARSILMSQEKIQAVLHPTESPVPESDVLTSNELNAILAGDYADTDTGADTEGLNDLVIRAADVPPEAQALFDAGDNAAAFEYLRDHGYASTPADDAAEEDAAEPIYWEDLEDLYKSVGEAIGGTALGVQQILEVPGLREHVSYANELAVAVNGLHRDLNHFADKLVNIHAQHLNHTGEINEQSQYIEYLSIGDQYRTVAEEFMAITAPALMTISEHTGAALQNTTQTSEEAHV